MERWRDGEMEMEDEEMERGRDKEMEREREKERKKWREGENESTKLFMSVWGWALRSVLAPWVAHLHIPMCHHKESKKDISETVFITPLLDTVHSGEKYLVVILFSTVKFDLVANYNIDSLWWQNPEQWECCLTARVVIEYLVWAMPIVCDSCSFTFSESFLMALLVDPELANYNANIGVQQRRMISN